MALANKAATSTAAVATEAKQGKSSASQVINSLAKERLASKTEEERSALGSQSGTLHFKHLLGLASKNAPRRVAPNENIDCPKPVGVVLVSDIDISVPVIPITQDHKTGVKAEDIGSRDVKAGEQFNLSYIEYMFLMSRDEYAGYASHEGNDKGVFFSAKFPSYASGKAKLPTPTINLESGSVKSSIVAIDEKTNDGWVIKDEYKEKYGDLLRKATPRRAAGAKSSIARPTLTALALQKILADATN